MSYDKKTVDNNFMYHAPSDDQVVVYTAIRNAVKKVAMLFLKKCPESPERTLAIRKLEEAVMWANASIARHPPEG